MLGLLLLSIAIRRSLALRDRPTGKMSETEDGGGRFTEVILKPEIVITAESNLETAKQLHHKAHELCFIANSVNFPILIQSTT